jgi:HPt (histidine-containing phosphotransfer) domain-containing protein
MITVMSSAMDELVERFKDEAVDRFGQIQQLLTSLPGAVDPALPCDEIRDHAHKLKGAAGVLGFPVLKDRASELEEAAASQAGAADGDVAAGAIAPAVEAVGAVLPE